MAVERIHGVREWYGHCKAAPEPMTRAVFLANAQSVSGQPGVEGRSEESGAHPRRLRDDAPTLPPPPLFDAKIPVVVMEAGQLRRLPLDPRAGFLLSLIDGSTTTEDLLDISGMPRDEFRERLDVLIQERVVVLK